jgi:hypothetical protein
MIRFPLWCWLHCTGACFALTDIALCKQLPPTGGLARSLRALLLLYSNFDANYQDRKNLIDFVEQIGELPYKEQTTKIRNSRESVIAITIIRSCWREN